MTLLLLTSTTTARLGLAEGGRIVARDEFPIATTFAKVIAERARQLVEAHDSRRPADLSGVASAKTEDSAKSGLTTLDSIVVHAGPGGFTSLRIGVTTANALAYALGVPVIGVRGPVENLEKLYGISNHSTPAPQGIVVPVYSKCPDIGPLPGGDRGRLTGDR